MDEHEPYVGQPGQQTDGREAQLTHFTNVRDSGHLQVHADTQPKMA